MQRLYAEGQGLLFEHPIMNTGVFSLCFFLLLVSVFLSCFVDVLRFPLFVVLLVSLDSFRCWLLVVLLSFDSFLLFFFAVVVVVVL